MKLGIIGSGRWAKIVNTVAVSHNIDTVFYSERNTDNLKLQNYNTVDSLDELDVTHAWVCTYPADHYKIAKQLLNAGVNLIVEKPFVLDVEQAHELVAIAKKSNLVLNIGYEYEYNNLIPNVDNPKEVKVIWHNNSNVQRHGHHYVKDPTVSDFTDFAPHVMTICRKLLNIDACPDIVNIHQHNSHSTEFSFNYNDTSVTVYIDSQSDPARKLIVDNVEYDLSLDNNSLDRQLIDFISLNHGNNAAYKNIWIDEFIQSGNQLLRSQHIHDVQFKNTDYRKQVLSAYVSKDLIDAGIVNSAYDIDQLNKTLESIISIIDHYIKSPFVTQRQISEALLMSVSDLIKLNTVIRNNEFIQDCIVNDIRNEQYWKNTILPLNQTGTIDKVLSNEYGFPLRIGLHIGQSCMFWCTFCGRNMEKNSYYDRRKLADTSKHVINVLKTAPNNDPYRFYLSGGLETLTNPYLMDMINAGADRGFKLSLYTNAYMLTKDYVDKHPDLWRLEVLRISLYGSNDEVYKAVTKHPKGFQRVKQNAIDFLKTRGDNNKTTRFGFNYVVLPGYEEDVLAVIDLIEEINKAAGYQINFLTLREDFKTPNDHTTFGNREKLKQVFAKVEQRRQGEWLNQLHIDYGYALNALRTGVDSPTMHCITESQMRPKGFPQVDLVVDAYGCVFLYREAGFLDRPGNDRYIIGQVDENNTLEDIVNHWLLHGEPIVVQQGDTEFMDSYEHIVSLIVNQNEEDNYFGIPVEFGPILGKLKLAKSVSIQAFYQGDKSAKVVR